MRAIAGHQAGRRIGSHARVDIASDPVWREPPDHRGVAGDQHFGLRL